METRSGDGALQTPSGERPSTDRGSPRQPDRSSWPPHRRPPHRGESLTELGPDVVRPQHLAVGVEADLVGDEQEATRLAQSSMAVLPGGGRVSPLDSYRQPTSLHRSPANPMPLVGRGQNPVLRPQPPSLLKKSMIAWVSSEKAHLSVTFPSSICMISAVRYEISSSPTFTCASTSPTTWSSLPTTS